MTENKIDMDLFFVLKQTKMSNSKTISPLKVLFIFQDLGRHCNHYANKHIHFLLQINLEEYAQVNHYHTQKSKLMSHV